MVKEVVTVETNATVRRAVRLMNNREIGCLVVVKEGKPAGIVTERDMLKRVLVAGRDPRAVEVGEIMSKPLFSMKSMAFAPGNISCIFVIRKNKNPAKSGSLGLGFTVNKGVFATITKISNNKKSLKNRENYIHK